MESSPARSDALTIDFRRLDALVAATAHAVVCPAAWVYLCDGAGAGTVVSEFGTPRTTSHAELHRARLPEDAIVANDPFVACAGFCVDEVVGGFVCVEDIGARTLTAAQHYVLRTLAHEMAHCITGRVLADPTQARSEHRRQSERLRLLESVVVNANDAVLITEAEPIDLPGPRILYANAAFTRTTGYELDEILGQTPRILQGPDTSSDARGRLRQALAAWQPIELELKNYRKDGNPFWVELSIVPVADETGRFTHWVSVQRDVTERKALSELAVRAQVEQAEHLALAYRASHDDLTGLANRSAFLRDLTAVLEPGTAMGRSAVVFLDLDRFKIVNDSLGHRVGDEFLIEIGRRLTACAHPRGTVARMGGDEFACLIRDLACDEDAVAIVREFLAALRAPIRLAGQSLSAGASIGICYIAGQYESPEDVLRDADAAMYCAKHDGGGRYTIYTESMNAGALARLRAQMDLHAALEREQFVLHYQPIVELRTGTVRTLEALVRWDHPEHGMIAPADFIPTAEEIGAIVPLGSWVLRAACQQAAIWNAGRAEPIRVCVNVSSRQLNDHDFFEVLSGAIAASGLDPRALEIEITESVFLEYPERVGNLLERIRSFCVSIALDDFGTGYSSLSYLERYPINTLKIDRSFIERSSTSSTALEIVRLIAGVAKTLAIAVTAEGIETTDQLVLADECGCSHVQGFYLSRPLSATDATRYLDEPGQRLNAIDALTHDRGPSIDGALSRTIGVR